MPYLTEETIEPLVCYGKRRQKGHTSGMSQLFHKISALFLSGANYRRLTVMKLKPMWSCHEIGCILITSAKTLLTRCEQAVSFV